MLQRLYAASGVCSRAGHQPRLPQLASMQGGIPATPPTTKNTACRAYIVQQGDSLSSIAQAVGAGRELSSRATAAPRCCLAPSLAANLAPHHVPQSHVQFGVTTNDLLTVNPALNDPSLLTPGYQVDLPPYPTRWG